MAEDGFGTFRVWCPACLTPVDDLERCPVCDLSQVGPDPARLRVVVSRLHDLSVEQARLAVETRTLDRERLTLLDTLRDEPEPVPTEVASFPDAQNGFADWRPERVRDALLWLGALLLALSAITFAIVAWARLGDAGRATLLLGATGVAGGAAIGFRHRLRATAEALTALTLALGLVDWYVVRRSGIGGDIDVATWWALGTGLIGVVALVGAVRLDLRSARLGAALLGLAAGGFTVAATTSSPWTAAVAGALVASTAAAAATAADRRPAWRDVGSLLTVGWVGFEVGTIALALAALASNDASGYQFGAALAILASGLAPAVAVALAVRSQAGTNHGFLVAVSAAAVIGAPLALLHPDLDPMGLAALAATLGLIAVGLGRLAPARMRAGIAGAGALAIGIPLVGVSSEIVLALTGPLAWLSDPWTGALSLHAAHHFGPTDARTLSDGWAIVVVLLAVAGATTIARSRPRGAAPFVSGTFPFAVIGGSLAAALAVALPATGASIGTVLGAELAVAVALMGLAVVLEARRPASVPWILGTDALLIVPVAGWAAVEQGATIATLGVLAIAAVVTGARARGAVMRATLISVAALAVTAEAGVVAGSTNDSVVIAGFAIAVAGGMTLVLGALARTAAVEGPPLEAVGLAGLAAGVALSGASTPWLAGALTVSAAALGVAALRADRSAYSWSTAFVAVAALWAWLAAADVSVLEAYTLPAAAVLLGAGVLRRRVHAGIGSWAAYGPGLVLALGPSLLVALTRGGAARPLGVMAAALVCVLVGSRRRLRAPLSLGAAALVALAIDNLGPVAARAPRWVVLGAIGLLMLWLGASAERRLNQLRGWRESLNRLV